MAAAGGPEAYVDVWLTAESEAPAWRNREQAVRQLALFYGEIAGYLRLSYSSIGISLL